MADLAGAGKAGGELDPIPPPPLIIPPNVKPEVLISPKYSIMARCGTGTTGRHIQLLANHFKVTVKAIDSVFYQYCVHVTAEDKREVEGKGIGRKLVDRLFQTYPSELAGKKFGYDGEKLNTVGPLPQNKLEFTVLLEETFAKSETGSPIDGPEKRSRRTSQSKTFTVEFSYAAKIPLKSIALALRGANVENTQDALRVFDIILHQQAANMGCLLVRQSFFHDDSRNFTDIGTGVIGLSLNMDVSTTMILTPGPVIDFLMANQGVREPRYIDWVKAKKMLKNMRIKTRHRNMEFKIIGISEKPCNLQYFSMKLKTGDGASEGETADITVFEYFTKHCGIELTYSQYLPCLDIGKPKRPNYLPLELCALISLQRYTKALSSQQRASLVEKSRLKPQDRIKTVTDLLTRLVYDWGSTDAAGKVAEVMCADFMHEVISACVPPVFPPRTGHGWACLPVIPTFPKSGSENKVLSPSFKEAKPNCYSRSSALPGIPLDQFERFPTSNRWIQMQTNLHRVSEFAVTVKETDDNGGTRGESRAATKRLRELDSDTESEVDDVGGSIPTALPEAVQRCMHKWELDAALDVLTMCSCHLLPSDPIREEVMYKRQALLRYSHILSADEHYSSWQEVEAECKEDPEGLALRLAGKGAVSAALEVAESALIKPKGEPLTDDMAGDDVPIAVIHLEGATGNQEEEPVAAQGREGRFQERLRQRKRRSAPIMMMICMVFILFTCCAASELSNSNHTLHDAQALKLAAEAELIKEQLEGLKEFKATGSRFLVGLVFFAFIAIVVFRRWGKMKRKQEVEKAQLLRLAKVDKCMMESEDCRLEIERIARRWEITKNENLTLVKVPEDIAKCARQSPECKRRIEMIAERWKITRDADYACRKAEV